MEDLERRFGLALSGQRQIVFVTGEPGIGKSALVGAFTDRLDRSAVKIAHGQCLDHHGVGEPYLPLIEALTRLGAPAEGARIKTILATHAPSWLAQMPSLWTRSERSALEARGRATRERMLRELTQAVEAIAADAPLVLTARRHSLERCLDARLARACGAPARARPPDGAGDLPAGRCGGDLGRSRRHHGGTGAARALPRDRSEPAESRGHRDLSDGQAWRWRSLCRSRAKSRACCSNGPAAIRCSWSASSINWRCSPRRRRRPARSMSIPHDVRRFIERQIDDLDDSDRELLTAASVIRREFATAAVAAALEADDDAVEAACARLARQGVFIVKSGSATWPDGTPAELYAFRHDLYRELLYDRLPATRRALSHARVGRRLEAAWSGRLDAIAAEIAEHFERGNELARAIPLSPARRRQGLAPQRQRRGDRPPAARPRRDRTHRGRGRAHQGRGRAARRESAPPSWRCAGFGAPEVLEAYSRAEALCERLGERVDLFPAIWGQWMFRTGRSEIDASRRLCARLLALAEKFGDAGLKLQAHHAMWATSFACGELAKARAHAQSGLALFDAKIHQSMASSYGNHDAACCARNFSAMSLALAGDGEGRTRDDRSIARRGQEPRRSVLAGADPVFHVGGRPDAWATWRWPPQIPN